MQIAVIGMGYVGITTAACLAEKFRVVGLDIDESRVAQLNEGSCPIKERGLQELLRKGLRKGQLAFTSSYDEIDASIAFLTVGTPGLDNGDVDFTQIESALNELGRTLVRRHKVLVVIRSTVPPGTTRKVAKPILESASAKVAGKGFWLAANPEFLREGSAVDDTHNPSRIVLGSDDSGSMRRLFAFYRTYYGRQLPPTYKFGTDVAELVKYASNAFLASRVSYINLIARLCERLPHANIDRISDAIGADPRIGRSFFKAGPGFGGSCFPKDVSALSAYARKVGVDSEFFDGILRINSDQVSHIAKIGGGNFARKTVAILGLAFKPGTDDVRESPALRLISHIRNAGGMVRVFDPEAMANARNSLGTEVYYAKSIQDCLQESDACFIMTDWPEFKRLSVADVREMRRKLIVDTRRVSRSLQDLRDVEWKAVGVGPADSA